MFLSQGIDIVDNKRIEMLFTKYGDVFKKKILSKDEIIDIDKIISQKKQIQKISSRYAAKEATAKAIGTGFRMGLKFTDIEITYDELGKPKLLLNDLVIKKILKLKKKVSSNVSISNEKNYTVAVVTFFSL
jgi:holo-[acyl-carrier protein] synthase|tara:strand:+ start:162 stop:554 length:393 start_codon:yes stop_codon:yes gene_type:complete